MTKEVYLSACESVFQQKNNCLVCGEFGCGQAMTCAKGVVLERVAIGWSRERSEEIELGVYRVKEVEVFVSHDDGGTDEDVS